MALNEHEKALRAQTKVEAITGFYIHFAIFVLVMVMLLAIDYANDPAWWVQWPFLGWGIGVAAHGGAVFGRMPAAITRWQLRKIKTIKAGM